MAARVKKSSGANPNDSDDEQRQSEPFSSGERIFGAMQNTKQDYQQRRAKMKKPAE